MRLPPPLHSSLPCHPRGLPPASEVRALLEDEEAGPGLRPDSDPFWIMVAALKAFVVGGRRARAGRGQ